MQRGRARFALLLFVLIALAGCSTTSQPEEGAYYLNDGPLSNPPVNLDTLPDAKPKPEPLDANANKPYSVMGHLYVPLTHLRPFHEKGVASWYGRRYQGQPTSDGERYNLWAMTAASPILPLPCYARVTNLDNGRSVIVRVNDRGPFLSDRIMDLSYAAAYKLGYAQKGIARVSVDLIDHPGSYEARTDPPRQEISDIGELVAGNWYLQLGAYTNRDDAEHLLVKARQVGSVVLTQQDGIFRVEGGPYPSRVAAQQEAGSFGHALGLDPMVILARP